MSIKLMRKIWGIDLDPSPKFVLIAIADFADSNNMCFPSNATLALRCGMTVRTVQRNKAILKSMELIDSSVRLSKGLRQTSNTYKINLDAVNFLTKDDAGVTLGDDTGVTLGDDTGVTPLSDHMKTQEEVSSNALTTPPLFFIESCFSNAENKHTKIPVSASLLESWKAAYKSINVQVEVEKVQAWLISNKNNIKSPSRLNKFVMSWLSKCTDEVKSINFKPRLVVNNESTPSFFDDLHVNNKEISNEFKH